MPSIDPRELAAIFLGGGAGALLRVWLGHTITSNPSGWPWLIFAVNVSGSFALGYLASRLQPQPRPTYRMPLLGAGFCGAYTTFSTMQVEILTMLEHDRFGMAFGYAVASVGAGYAAIVTASSLARRTRVHR